jgi:hypothetical protein
LNAILRLVVERFKQPNVRQSYSRDAARFIVNRSSRCAIGTAISPNGTSWARSHMLETTKMGWQCDHVHSTVIYYQMPEVARAQWTRVRHRSGAHTSLSEYSRIQVGQSSSETLDILRRGGDHNVEVLRQSLTTVRLNRYATDRDVFDSVTSKRTVNLTWSELLLCVSAGHWCERSDR